MAYAIHGCGRMRRFNEKNKYLGWLVSYAVVVAFFAVLVITLSMVNAVIVTLHVAAFILITGALFWAYSAATKRDYKKDLSLVVALALSVVYLSAGYYTCHHVVRTDYNVKTDKPVGSIRVAMFADSHLGTTFNGEGFERELKKIKACSPDILFVVGDFVDDDTRKKDMETASRALGKLDLPYGVWYTFGNHDRGYFQSRDFTAEELKQTLIKNKIHVMQDTCALVDDRFYVVGREDAYTPDRNAIEPLLNGLDKDKYIIVLNHEPNDYENEAKTKADLVLSGHTHGGQLFPWTFLSRIVKADDNVYGRQRINDTDFIVTSGISDWAIKFKTFTLAEYVIIDIHSKDG